MSEKKNTFHGVGERNLSGATATASYKSKLEAPEVGDYDYENVEIQAFDGGAIDLNLFNDEFSTTLFGVVKDKNRTGEAPRASVESLLNDALMCIRIDDGQRLMDILILLKNEYELPYPADAEFGYMFKDTLWNRVSDEELVISGSRDDAVDLLKYFHQD